MPPREFNGIVNAATGSSPANRVADYAGLCQQVLESDIDIAGPRLCPDFVLLLRRELVISRAAALSEASIIQRENVDSQCRQTFAEHVPQLSLLVALVEE